MARRTGVPDNPAAWLNTTARFLADRPDPPPRHPARQVPLVAASQPQALEPDLDEIVDGDLADDLLGLIFMACHPILSPDARSALTLKLVCGLSTDDVARAFLTPTATIAQRIVRAKRTLAAAKVRFELPAEARADRRLDAVREVIYLVFNEGYSATSGDQWIRSDLCAEALRLGRMLAALDAVRHRDARPARPDRAAGVAVAGAHRARRRAGAAARPGPHPLGPAPDPARPGEHRPHRAARRHGRSVRPPGGDRGLPRAGRAPRTPTGSGSPRSTTASPGSARRRSSSSTAGSRPRRPSAREAGLEIVLPLFDVPGMRRYHLLSAVAGDLLCRSGEHEQAREHFLRAASMTQNNVERTTMQNRAAQCAAGHTRVRAEGGPESLQLRLWQAGRLRRWRRCRRNPTATPLVRLRATASAGSLAGTPRNRGSVERSRRRGSGLDPVAWHRCRAVRRRSDRVPSSADFRPSA